MGLPTLGMMLGVAGTLVQGRAEADAAKAEAKAANIQIRADMEVERISAMEKGNARLAEFQRLEAANRVNAAINAPSGGRDFSYEQGIAPYNLGVAAHDVSNIQFNAGQKIGRLGYQIKLNTFQAKYNARSAIIGSYASSAQQVGTFIQEQSNLAASKAP